MRAFGCVVFAFILFAYGFVVYEYIESDNSQLDVASAILCENAAKYGRVDIIEKFARVVENKYAKDYITNCLYYAKKSFVPLPELLKNRPKVGRLVIKDRLLCNELIKRFYYMDSNKLRKNLRSFEYAISYLQNTPIKAKMLYLIGSKIDEGRYISKANEILRSKQNWSVEYTDTLIDIAEIALENKNVDDYFKYMDMAPYSYRKAAMYYLVCKDKNTLKRANELSKGKKISSISQWNMRAILPAVKYLAKDISVIYSIMNNASIFVYQGGSSYKLREHNEYKYPSIMLLSYFAKNNDLLEKYKNLALSDDAYESVKIRYLDYVYFASIAFYMTGNQKESSFLLDRVKNPQQKAILYKKTMRYISDDEALLDFIAEKLLDLYNIKAFSRKHVYY